jgi:hypothetical protein
MVISFKSVNDKTIFSGLYHCGHKNGQLIYAAVKTETLYNALAVANFLIRKIKEATAPGDVN